jgi:coenzyme F420 hydrogenase subunit beta
MAPNPVERVVCAGMCVGCGLCASVLGHERVSMMLVGDGFHRPQVKTKITNEEGEAFAKYCPGISLRVDPRGEYIHPLWGPIVSIRTGYATDTETRYVGSSGGGLSALLVSMLESGRATCVVHTAADPISPTLSRGTVSRTREDILRCAGSRYAPSAPLNDIVSHLEADERIVFAGKPCDVAGLQNFLRVRPALAERVVLTVSFMCAGTPSDHGTREILANLGVKQEDVVQFWYRGRGWPGSATAVTMDGGTFRMDYQTSWGTILNRHLQFRCKVCPDGTGEGADVTFADAWYGEDGYPDFDEREGRSLVITRSAQGEIAVAAGMSGGYLVCSRLAVEDVEAMQPYQANRKRLVLSRLMAVFLRTGVWPSFRNLRILTCALGAPLIDQLRSFRGTFRRLR